MRYILSHQILGGPYSKWVAILFEFDLVFTTPKAKKYLVFTELMARLPWVFEISMALESLRDYPLFRIDS